MTDARRIRILFLAASPGSMGQVNSAREAREIREALRATAHRDSIELVERFAVRPGDLQRAFFEVRPHIVHFSAHGTTDEEIVLENDDGGAEPLGKRALADLFRVHKDQVRVVVLNACHSRPQVEAISEHIDCAIGMRRAIGSQAATEFASAFYLAIGFGSSVQKAIESAVAELRAKGIPEDRTPQLVLRAGTDASRVLLISSSSPPEVAPKPSALAAPAPPEPAPPESIPASREPQAPSEPMGRGENRICTVMSIDLSSVAALSARLDPSEVKDLLDRCQRAIAEPIEALGGRVDRRGSDGAIGVFGALRADEGDAERAVHAAIRLQAALAKIPLPRGTRALQKPSARIGISTGRVFAEVARGAGAKGFTVIGEAVTAASRLEQAAALGAILISRDTSRLIAGRFNVEPLPPVAALGQGEPIAAFRVIEPVSVQHGLSPRDFHGLDTKLVGRGAERQRLLDALDALTRERRAAHITLAGPPGVGRSRMLAEIVAGIATTAPIFILSAAQGSALAASTSYGFAAALIRRRFDIPEGAPPDGILRRLRRGVRWLRARVAREEGGVERPPASDVLGVARAAAPTSADIDDALIQIAGLLDTQKASPAPGRWTTPDLDGSALKNRLVAAVACLVRFAAALAPVVVLCDDAQWVDDASLDLLDEIVFRVEDLPLLVVCAARPDLYERRPHWGEGKATHRRVDLAPLEPRHIEEMIRDRLRRARALSPGFMRTVADRAEGNPFILDETLRFLMDAGVIEVPADGGPWIVHELGLRTLTLPTTVQGIMQARLDRLEPPARAFLARAAVVGKTFWESAVEELLRHGRRAARSPKTAEIIALLRERQLVRARETTTFPGERERVFAESAAHEVAYETLPAQVRRPLHLLVARWLKDRAPGIAHAALLALHYDLGGDLRAASEAYERAAAHASSLGQNAEALRHLLRACDLCDELKEEASGDGAPAGLWRDQVRVRLDLGDVLRRLGRLDEAEAAYAKAREGIPAGDPEAPRWEARADFRMALSLKVRGSTAAARELVERALALAKEGGIPEETPGMYALLTFLYRREQRPLESWRTSLEGLRVCRALQRPDDRSREIAARALLGLAAGLYMRKRWIAAERTYRQAARIAAGIGDLDLLGRAQNGVAVSLFARGDNAGSRAHFAESLRIKQKAGDLHQIAVAYTNLAELENEVGEHAAALDHARRSARLSEQIHAESDLGEIYRNLGAALLGLGQVDAAIDACLHALRVAEKAGPLYLPGIVETLVKVCERAVSAAPASSLLAVKLMEVTQAVTALRERRFADVTLRGRLDALRALLEARSA